MRILLLVICTVILFNTLFAQKASNCLSFNGKGEYINCGNNSLLNIKKEITIEAWIKADTLFDWVSPLSYIQDNGINESGYGFVYLNGEIKFMLTTKNMYSDYWNVNPGAKIKYNQWCHIAGVYDGNMIKFYLNGKLVSYRTTQGDVNWQFNPIALCIGSYNDDNETFFFDGQIDEVKIWNTARSIEEINEFIYKPLSGNEDNLVAYYNFDKVDSGILEDKSVNNINGELINIIDPKTELSMAMLQPKALTVATVNDNGFILNWTPIEGTENIQMDGYIIEIALDEEFKNYVTGYNNKFIGNVNSYEITNLNNGLLYYCRVRVVSSLHGETVCSKTICVNDLLPCCTIYLKNNSLTKLNNIEKTLLISKNIAKVDKIEIPFSDNSFTLLYSSNYSIIDDGDVKFRYKLDGYNDNWNEIDNSNGFIIYSNIPSGKYRLLVQSSIKGGKWKKAPVSVEIIIIKSFWETNLFFIILVVFIISLIILILKKRYIFKLSVQKKILIRDDEQEIIDRIMYEIENERIYLKRDLTLDQFSNHLEISKNEISRILNKHFKQNFKDYINKFRIDEAVKLMTDPEYDKYNFSVIAEKCGFNSITSFYRSFKKYTRKTPAQYSSSNKSRNK